MRWSATGSFTVKIRPIRACCWIWRPPNFRDNRLGEAAEHFAQTQRYELPAPVAANVSRYRQAIARQTGWRWSGGISPVRNSNVNNAPPRYCIDRGVRLCSVSEPLAANGLNYELGVEKLTPLHEHHYLQFRANFSGTSYFFDRKSAYDDAFGRAISAGSGAMAGRLSAYCRFTRHSFPAAANLTANRKTTAASPPICWRTASAFRHRTA